MIEETITQHGLDEKNISTHDALEKFRSLFPLTRVNVWNPEKGMSYTIKHGQFRTFARKAFLDACKIISTTNLPLKVRMIHSIYEDILIIESK